MIYLVSKNQRLFESPYYKVIPFSNAINILNPLREVQLDTETEGLDPHSKALLTVQLGCTENQVVFDWITLTNGEKLKLKEYLESNRLFIGHNIGFDLCFLYKQDIWVKNIYDTMIAEQLLYLGFPKVITSELYNELNLNLPQYEYISEPNKSSYYELSYSLKATAKRTIGVDIDKTVRGKIVNVGLTDEVINYAAGDVLWLEQIKEVQLKQMGEQDLIKAHQLECEFTKALAYCKFCGVHLDRIKWQNKIKSDLKELQEAEEALNDWVINWDENKEFTSINLQGDLFTGFDDKPKCTINWSSSQQVIPLFERIGIHVNTFDKKTKKKKKSIEEKQLSPQADQFEIIPLYLRYQGAKKVTTTYGENWLNAINPVTGRVHAEYHQIGTDTARLSSGGGPYKINCQNLPHDKETRACFTAEKGNVFISCDYQSQESRLIASVANDKAMIDLFENGCGDVHSLVAYMSYPDIIPRDTRIEDIKKLYPNARQEAKGIEFSVNYGGDANTIASNKGIPIKEATKIYNDFMKGFPGVSKYQEYCRKKVMEDGFIIMNSITKHRAHIYDAEWLFRMQEKFKDLEFWQYYNEMKSSAPTCDTVRSVKRYFKRKSETEKQSINYKIQNRGAMCFKLASIKLFNWIINNNYQNIVKLCVPVHDEWNLECPEPMKDEVADILVKCMVAGGKPFCPNVFLGADVSVDDHWVH